MRPVNDHLHASDEQNPSSAGPSRPRRLDVCLICGKSLATRQSNLILRQNPTVLMQRMVDIIQNKKSPYQVPINVLLYFL